MAARVRPLHCLLCAVLALLAAPSLAHAAPPANDNFAAAELITGDTATVTGTSVEATKETGEPNHAGHTGGRSVWYRWIAPSDGVVTLDTAGTSYNEVVALYTGASVDGLTAVAANHGERMRVPVRAGVAYSIALDYCTGSGGNHSLSLAFETSPANDTFASPQVLTGAEATATPVSNRAASGEAGEPYHGGAYGRASVWYAWTAPWTGAATVDTAASNFNTALGVYTGDTLGGLVRVAQNDDASSSVRTSRVTFHATAGVTYRIAVDSGYYSSNYGDVGLSLRLREAPANDAFSTAVELPSAAQVSTTGRNDGASAETGEPSHYNFTAAHSSVWYRWTAPKDGSLTLTSSSNFGAALAVYRGSQVSGLTRVINQAQPCNCAPGQIRVRADAGATYYIAVDSRYLYAGGDFGLSLSLIDRPANDDFANSQLLAGVSVDVTGTNLGATQEVGEPIHDDNYYDPSVWYSWTAPSTGGVTLDTADSTFNTVTAVYTGTSVGALTRVQSNRVTGPTSRVKRAFRAVAGQTYRIAVDGAAAAQGDIKLALRHHPVPANDMFAAAAPLAPGVPVDGDNMGATAEPGEPSLGGTAGATVWYSWTPAETGPAKLSLAKSDFGPALAVYTGDTVNGLTSVPILSGRFRGERGVTYRIKVDGGSTPLRGTFTLLLETPTPVPNDDFANAIELTGNDDAETGTTVNATREPGEPYLAYNGAGSVWYRWTAATTGPMTIDLTGSGYYIRGAVYTGDRLGALTRVAEGGLIKFNGRAGTTYRIAVEADYGYGSTVKLALRDGLQPANDYFDTPTELSGLEATVSANTREATRETGEPSHVSSGYASLWYTWTAPRTGPATLDLTGSFANAGTAVYTGTSFSGLTRIASGNKIRWNAQEGTTYRIAVDGAYWSTGPIQFALVSHDPPANDAFADAEELSGDSDSATGSTVHAGTEPGEPRHFYESSASVWYEWTAERNAAVTFDTAGSAPGLGVAVYTGSSVDSLTKVGSGSKTKIRATAGTTYRIAVDGAGHAAGPVSLSVTAHTPPANDDFAGAEELTGESDSTSGDTADATYETGERQHVSGGAASLWYEWTAPRTGLARINLSTTNSYLQAVAYTGNGPGSADLTRIGSATGSFGMRFRAVEGRTYRIAVDGWYASTGAFGLDVVMPQGPVNDEYENAEELSGIAAATTGSNVNATAQPGEPAPYEIASATAWYRWTAPATGPVTLDLTGSSFDTQIGVYRGTDVSSLTRVLGQRSKRVTFRAQEGTTYSFQVDGYYATGDISLALAMSPGPANDDFARPDTLSGDSATRPGSTIGATREVGEPVHQQSGSASVWYEWTAPSNGALRVSASGDGFSPLMGVYTGPRVDALTRVASASNGVATMRVVRGTTYKIAVDGPGTQSGPIELSLALTAAPPHDDFADATVLEGTSPTDTATNHAAGRQPGEPSLLNNGGSSVWYRWTAPSNGRLTIDLTPTGFDPLSAVYTGTRIDALNHVTSRYEDRYSLNVRGGETYAITVDGMSGTTGTIKLALGFVSQPPNDDFAAGEELTGESATATADTTAATAESGEPSHHGGAGKSVWYRWTAPSDGQTSVDLAGSSFDTVLAVYRGASLSGLTVVGRNNDNGTSTASRLSWTAAEGTTYHIAVDGYQAAWGAVALKLDHVPAPPPAPQPPADEGEQQQDEQSQEEEQQQEQIQPTRSTPPGPRTSQASPAPAPRGPSRPPAAYGGNAAPLSIQSAFPRQKLKRVLARGLTGTVSCPTGPCAIEISVSLDARSLKKLGLRAAGGPPFSAAAINANGATKFVLRPNRAAKRKLRKAKSLKLKVRIVARSGTAAVGITRRVTIKR